MSELPDNEICRRIANIRLEMDGPRGKSAFAARLGLSPSTYEYYEQGRVPPAPVLVKIANLAGVDLRWLLTGKVHSPSAPADHPVLQRAAALIGEHPQAAAQLAAFVDLLSGAMEFPQKAGEGAAQAMTDTKRAAGPASPEAIENVGRGEEIARFSGYVAGEHKSRAVPDLRRKSERLAMPDMSDLIPILGRSAAGVPQFWANEKESQGLTTLGKLIAGHARRSESRSATATAWTGEHGFSAKNAQTVQIITLADAAPGEGTAQFVAAPQIKARYRDAFALQIDGDSMSPDIRHGDIVILCPSVPAADGKAAVVQLEDQIGVTCKLFRRSGQTVHLVPLNEQLPPQSFPAGKVMWALRVLALVRP